MDIPVSAYAIYKSNTSANKEKKFKKRNKAKKQTGSPNHLPPLLTDEKKQINFARKLKMKQKKAKELKNIMKKNQQKKKNKATSRNEKKVRPDKISIRPIPRTQTLDAPAEIPVLLEASKQIFNLYPAAELFTHSSGGEIFDFTPVVTDSAKEGRKVFEWMMAPYDIDYFFKNVWEKKPLHISRGKCNYYKDIISTPIIDDMLRNENIQFTKNIDITSYVDGQRETHNPEGRAHPQAVWDFYLNGCSVRLLNPQTYIPKLHLLNATMQEFFNTFVGANAYLTPPDSQGFAPHYDDIEAFILQTEGSKHWRIYEPLSPGLVLPRVSSKNFDQNEIGRPIAEVTLQAGDILYFPRGYIHQGVTVNGEHSLHVTISLNQKNAWADVFEKLIPAALQMAINKNVDLRTGIPIDFPDHFGLVHTNSDTPRKRDLKKVIMTLFDKLKKTLPMAIDHAADQMLKEFQHAALPPVLNNVEKSVTVFGDSNVMIENGHVTNRVEISPDTRIRLLRKNILRMVAEEKIRLYYHVENSLEYHGNELPFFEIEEEFIPAVASLITTYPDYIAVEDLELPTDADKLGLADALWSKGLIMTEYPLEFVDDD